MPKLLTRKFYVQPSLNGTIDGFEKGLSVSNNVFTVEKIKVRTYAAESFQQDVEAMRRDVRTAREKLTRSLGLQERHLGSN